MPAQVFFDIDATSVTAGLQKINHLLSPEMLGLFLGGPVTQYFQEKFDKFFEQEGTDKEAWVPLAEVTVLDRLDQGYGEGPINVRTGELKEWVTASPGQIRTAGATTVLTYPGPNPTGELKRKIATAQEGGFFGRNPVPARPVMDVDENDGLFILSALHFFMEKAML